MRQLPAFHSYGDYSSGNYGVNALCFTDQDGTSFYFSYTTLVAFETRFGERFVRTNVWGPTSGKHLNWIDGGSAEAKKRRLEADEFAAKLREYFPDAS